MPITLNAGERIRPYIEHVGRQVLATHGQ